jgi:hypothetical protein
MRRGKLPCINGRCDIQSPARSARRGRRGGEGVRGGQPPARSRAMERRLSSSHGELWVARPRVPTRRSRQRRRATEGRVGEGERRRTAAGRRVVRRKMSGGARDGRAGAGGKLSSREPLEHPQELVPEGEFGWRLWKAEGSLSFSRAAPPP